jgi:hypothetical protein
VMIVQDLISCHRSQRPANAKELPSLRPISIGCFAAPIFCHSKNPSATIKHRLRLNACRNSHLINAARSGAEKTQQALREFEAVMDRIGVSCGHDHATSAEACDCAQNR